jgi:hypothetical protein
VPRNDSGNNRLGDVALRHATIAVVWLFFICLFGLAVFLAFEAWRTLLRGVATDAVFWSALSACFSGASACGAVWVATQQQRWRKHDERARAYVVLAGLGPSLPTVIEALKVLAGQLQNVDGLYNKDSRHIESLQLTLQSANLHIGVGAITDLVIISRDLAAKLAQAVSIVRTIEHRVSWTLKKLETEEVTKHGLDDPEIKEWPDWADEARELFVDVKEQCDRDFAFSPKTKKTTVMVGLGGPLKASAAPSKSGDTP